MKDINKVVRAISMCYVVSVVLFFVFILSGKSGTFCGKIDLNMFSYLCLLTMFLIVFFSSIMREHGNQYSVAIMFISFIALLFIHAICKQFFFQKICNEIYYPVSYILFAGVFFVLLIIFYKGNEHLFKFALIVDALVIYSFYLLIKMNLFDHLSRLQHYAAYTNSIYNALHDVPFCKTNVSNYGHYACFYRLFSLFFGKSIEAINTMITLVSVLFGLFLVVSFHKVIRDKRIQTFAIAALGIFVCYAWKSTTYIGFPHRFLFFSINLLYFTKYSEKNFYRWMLGGCFINALALVWNTDFGIINIACYFTFVFVSYYKKTYGEFDVAKLKTYLFKEGLISYGAVALCIFTALGIVNIYNYLLNGPKMTISDLLYPIVGAKFDSSALVLPLVSEYSKTPFGIVLVVFNFAVFSTMIYYIIRGPISFDKILMLAISVYNIGAIGVAIHRYTYYETVYQFAGDVILIALILDGEYLKHITLVKKVIEVTLVLCSSYLFLGVFGKTYFDLKLDTKFENCKVIMNEIGTTLPSDVPAIGTGTEIIFDYLGRDKKYYITDCVWVDLNDETIDYVNEILNEEDDFFAEAQSASRFNITNEFVVQESWCINDIVYNYYVRSK